LKAQCRECQRIYAASRKQLTSEQGRQRRTPEWNALHRPAAYKYHKEWSRRNKEKMKAYNAIRQKEKAAEIKARKAEYQSKNKDKIKAYLQANANRIRARNVLYRQAHRAESNAAKALRRARIHRATPRWANHFFIGEIYDLAQLRSKALGFNCHVDHVVPLKSPLVCGLHVESNLRVVSHVVNHSKGNRTWTDHP
jgi:hypothetical protein